MPHTNLIPKPLRLTAAAALLCVLGAPAMGAADDPLRVAARSAVSPVGEAESLPYMPKGHQLPPPRDASIYRDTETLPEPVRRLREQLLEAARSGDVTRFAPIFAAQEVQPRLAGGEVDDPVEFLRISSNDGEARETMAILEEILEAPYAAFNEGTDDEFYVWPYFVATNLDDLTPSELVDCYKIVSHSDLEEMQLFGGWFFYRLAISSSGEWLAFIAGE